MSDDTRESGSTPSSLPDTPNLEWLRKEAKRRLAMLRQSKPDARLADAQFDLARQYGFSSWRALKAHVDSLGVDGRLLEATRAGDVDTVRALLDEHPGKLQLRAKPYEWSLLHFAAHHGHLAVVDLLLRRGLDVNVHEKGDNTVPMHWAAAAGHLDVVRRLADAGSDVVGKGDDHELEIIGWATFDDADEAHRAVVDFLVARGARHHIFSAIAFDLEDEVRRIVAADPAVLMKRMSHNENFQRPLHFAVRRNRTRMVALLLELGADPLATDGSGYTARMYATSPDVDRGIMELLRARGQMDLGTALALHEWGEAEELLREDQSRERNGSSVGMLHLMSKRGDVEAVRWLLDHGADPNALWLHWDADVTPLHLAVLGRHLDVVRLLLAAGADPTIRDTKHDSDAIGWAEFFGHTDTAQVLKEGRH